MSGYLPSKQKNLVRAEDLRANMTVAERKLWYDFLRSRHPRWRRQNPLLDYIVDFYCHAFKLVIEVDGESHLSEGAMWYDQRRTERLAALGITVIRFTNEEVLGDFETTCSKISTLVKPSHSVSLTLPASPPSL